MGQHTLSIPHLISERKLVHISTLEPTRSASCFRMHLYWNASVQLCISQFPKTQMCNNTNFQNCTALHPMQSLALGAVALLASLVVHLEILPAHLVQLLHLVHNVHLELLRVHLLPVLACSAPFTCFTACAPPPSYSLQFNATKQPTTLRQAVLQNVIQAALHRLALRCSITVI